MTDEAAHDGVPYLFVHVPKTAGTSFRLALEHAFGRSRIAYDYAPRAPETDDEVRQHVYEEHDLDALRDELGRRDVLVLGGHFPYRKYARIFAPTAVMAFFRDPIARVVAEYAHARRHHGFEGTVLEFAERPRNKSLQQKMLKGTSLDEVAFFGITERYAESIELLRRRLGWELAVLVTNVNPASESLASRYELTDDEETQLRAWNQDDIAFYEMAVHKFDEALAR